MLLYFWTIYCLKLHTKLYAEKGFLTSSNSINGTCSQQHNKFQQQPVRFYFFLTIAQKKGVIWHGVDSTDSWYNSNDDVGNNALCKQSK